MHNTIVENLKKLNLSHYPYIEIEEILQQITGGIFALIEVPDGKSILRVRPNEYRKRYYSRKDVSYKPDHLNNTYQRASAPKHTMFYGCISPEQDDSSEILEWRLWAIWEAIKKARDNESSFYTKVTFSRWEVLKPLKLISICENKELHDSHPYLKKVYDSTIAFADLNLAPHNTKGIAEFLAKEFSKEVNDSKDYEYMISAIFAKIICQRGFDGIIYPTPKIPKGYNVALSTSATDTKLAARILGECTFYKNKNQMSLSNDTQGFFVDQRLPVNYSNVPLIHRIDEKTCLSLINISHLSQLPYG